MNRFRHTLQCFTALVCLSAASLSLRAENLDAGFRSPPASAKPVVMWQWVNGNVSREGITADIEAMKRVGIAGVLLFEVSLPYSPDGPLKHGSPEWKALLRHTAEEADRLGIEFGFHNCPGWASSGGPWITPELSMQKLVWTERLVEGPAKLRAEDLSKPAVDPKWNFYRDVTLGAVPANDSDTAPKSTEVVVGTSLDLPRGKWRVLRFGHTTNGKVNLPAPATGTGLEFDKFSPIAAAAHYEGYAAKILTDLGELAGRSVTMVEMDSYEAGPQTWGANFEREFRARRGYDIRPWLPALTGAVIGSAKDVERFKEDVRRTVAELFDEMCYQKYAELVRSRPGMKFALEPYGGAFDPLTVARHGDLVAATFWNGVAWGWNDIIVTASACRTWGKNIVACEAFTGAPMATKWNDDPYGLKAMGDRAFALGVNRMVLHSVPHQPWKDARPGMTLGYFGTQFGRTQTWWEQSKPWMDYLARCQFLLQQGRYPADVLILDRRIREFPPEPPATTRPVPATQPAPPKRVDIPSDYLTDLIGEKALLDRATVRDGAIYLPEGQCYRVLVLPAQPTMALAVARKVREFVFAGATVVGPRPTSTPGLEGGPEADAELERLSIELWDSGRIKHASAQAALTSLGVLPPFSTRSKELLWTQRVVDDAHIFFISNQSDAPLTADCSFRVTGLQPELWDASTGLMTDARAFQQKSGQIHVPLSFDPRGSIFVVFRKPAASAIGTATSNTQTFEELATVPGPWTLAFAPQWGGPASVRFDTLDDWSKRPEPGIRYYSGSTQYHAQCDFVPKPGQQIYLNLGAVGNIAEVTLNDTSIATLWKPPFRCEITHAVRPGGNQLSIRVTNLWPNRLIGDEQEPADIEWGKESIWRASKPEGPVGRHLAKLPDWLVRGTPRPSPGRFTLSTWNYYSKDSPLLPSGLLGPVKIEVAK